MNSMAISLHGEGRSSQQSLSNRHVSLYASRQHAPSPPLILRPGSRPGSSSSTHSRKDRPPQLPEIPPLPVSPRWDSFSNGTHVLLHSPSSPPADWYEQPQHQPQHFTTQYSAPPSPGRDIQTTVLEVHNDPSSALTPLYADPRVPESPTIENFSRPRKASIKQPHADAAKLRLAYLPPSDLVPEMTNVSPSSSSWQQPRRPSVSSSKSSYTYVTSPTFSPTSEHFGTRARNSPAPPLSYGRPPLSYNRIDSAASAPLISPAPWLSGDELRSSFRSQLTASTAPGTALTERSSVLTKASSVASIDADEDADEEAEEPSLEDVMGMYERGFCDDDEPDDGNYDHDEYHHNESNPDEFNPDSLSPDAFSHQANHRSSELFFEDTRQAQSPIDEMNHITNIEFGMRHSTATSPPHSFPLDDSDAEPARPLPSSHNTLDAEIRQSKMLFSSFAFTSTVPALTHDHDMDHDLDHDVDVTEKRNSTRTAGSDPSGESDGARNDTRPSLQPKPTYISPPASTSRSVSPASSNLPVPKPEEPGSRDRYGFKKENQFITRKQYDAWDKGYSQYLARRRRKWTAYLKDSALMTEQPNRFPAPNAKTKRFVRKGIPPDWRGATWFYYAGGPAILAKHSGLYDKLLERKAKPVDVEAIERDLHRTFPDNISFKPSAFTADMLDTTTSSERASQSTLTGSASDGSGPGAAGLDGEPPIISALRRVLLAFSVYNPRIGYCQSLNFIAGLLLLFVKTEEQCFWLLNVITHIYLPGTHEMSLEGSKVDLGVLMTELRDTMPAVWDKIGSDLEAEPASRPVTSKSMRRSPKTPRLKRKDTEALSSERLPPITLCMTAWFMSCYIGTLPIEAVLRVWDVFFYEGSKTLFRVALGIFKLGESEIKAVSDPMEMFGVVQSMPRRMIDVNKLLDTCFKRRNGFNHLSQDVIEVRRQERRDKVRQDLQRQRGKTVNDVEVERKGTLFGRRK